MFKSLLKADFINIKRDPILIFTIAGPILFTLLLKFILPFLTNTLLKELNFDLTPYYPLILGFSLILAPMTIGSMTGFMLLEDKDENMFLYYTVTPLSKEGYLFYKLSIPIILNIVLSFFLVYLTNIITINFLQLLLIILMASIEAIIIAFFLTSFASNRVEGLAMTKAISFLFLIPLIDQLINFKYQWLFYLFPTYYIPKTIGLRNDSQFIKILVLGYIVHLVYLFIFYNKFTKKINV